MTAVASPKGLDRTPASLIVPGELPEAPVQRSKLGRVSIISLLLCSVAAVWAVGCSSDDDTKPATTTDDTGATDAGSTDGSSANDGQVATSKDPWFPDGEYFVGIFLAEFGVKMHIKAVVTGAGEKNKASQIGKIELWGISYDPSVEWTSDKAVATLTNIPMDDKGAFSADFGQLTVPGKSSPTGGDIIVKLVFHGKPRDATSWCGDLRGEVPDFKTKLEKSTFRAIKFGTQPKDGYQTACEDQKAKTYKPIATCPKLTDGLNKMVSAETTRSFYVHLPKSATATGSLPVVFLFHGVGGTAEKFKQTTEFEKLLSDNAFILVVPDSATIDGKKETLDWFFTGDLFDDDNRDLVFFDDALKCIGAAWTVDAKRIYVTGMSGGGMISTFIAAHRRDKVAAAAPFSGGYTAPGGWPDDTTKTPFMVTWGGPKDSAFNQNFDTLAKTLLGYLNKGKHPHVACDHGLEHKWPVTGSKDTWAFLSQFTLGGGEKPDIKGFPSYCKLP